MPAHLLLGGIASLEAGPEEIRRRLGEFGVWLSAESVARPDHIAAVLAP